jgi:predicted ester cyclase
MRAFTVVPGRPHTWPGMSPAARTVAAFLSMVRVTGDAAAAERLMGTSVPAHQHVAEHDETVVRSPGEYAAHVRDMLQDHGPFRFDVEELLVEKDHVFVRWLQHGHLPTAGPDSAARPLREAGSAVYRVDEGRIREYWIQLDRLGEHLQR